MPPDDASWGGLLNAVPVHFDTAWWLRFFPGLFLVFTMLAFNLLGDGLRDALDDGPTGERVPNNRRPELDVKLSGYSDPVSAPDAGNKAEPRL